MPRALIVGSSRSRSGGPVAARAVAALLRAAGWDVDIEIAMEREALRPLAAGAVEDGCEVVVAVGGDGTVTQVAGGLVGTPVRLGIIPTGTGNLLAGAMGIPGRPMAAARALIDGRPRRIDLGQVKAGASGDYFSVACGIGFDARVMRSTPAGRKRRWGRMAYVATAVALAGTVRNVDFEITLDGVRRRTHGAQVLVANVGHLTTRVRPRRPIRPDDGLLDVIVVRAAGPLVGLLAAWEALGHRRLGDHPGGRTFRGQAREVRIESERPQPAEIDGDLIGSTPVDIAVVPGALSVIVPRR
ncbi:MAG TPA: diacylglycerol kinase family protein [Candidatus Saccharimonadales bacterium]|nr:diacylglycerol kinase family protein [Candidatus Saccharimonadales bacterium]